MSESKQAFKRYQIIDRCLQSRTLHYGTKELKRKCEEVLLTPISLRQIQLDLDFLRELYGEDIIETYSIPSDKRKKAYRYNDPEFSIRKQPLKPEDKEALNEALQSLMTFEGRPEVQWIHELIGRIQPDTQNEQQQPVIIYDDNPDSVGLDHIHPLFQAIRKRTPLKITYKPFEKPEVLHFISPYLLKEYNNRWYILCKSNHFNHLTCLALDRIEKIEETTDYPYLPYPSNDDPKDFFFDFIGVTWEKAPVDTIHLHIKKSRVPYVLTKPIHHSQRHKTIEESDVWDEIRLKLIPNKEFYSQMLFFGDDLKVIGPPSVRAQMKTIVENMKNQYSD